MTQSAGKGVTDLTAFVGRERELSEVQAAWSECLSGRGGLFLISGEPGIGKTRFTQEVCHGIRAGGWHTLWGACTEDRAAPAYWPWVPILRALRADNEPEQSAVDPVARFLQDLAVGKLPPLAAAGAPAEESRFLFFDGVWCALKESAAISPLLIVLDDLHAADVASLSLLGALAPRLHDGRVLIVATYREVDLERRADAARLLNAAARHGRRIRLGGLSNIETQRLIELIRSWPLAADVAEEIYRRTDGNPLFVDEIARWMDLGDSTSRAGAAIPPGVRAVISERLTPLSPQCRRLLGVAAVIGRDVDLATLCTATGGVAADLVTLLDEARSADLLEHVDGGLGRYRFGHVLTRDVIYDDLEPVERARLHGAVGAALEQLQAGLLDAHLTDLAYHFGRAALAGGAEKAVDYAERAGERAGARLAYEDAARCFEQALEVLALCPPDPFRRGEIELALATARAAGGDARARASFQRAAALARSLLPANRKRAAQLLALAAIGMAERGLGLPQPLPDPEVRQLLGDALEQLAGDSDLLTARLLALLAMERALDAGDDQCVTLGARAIELAQRQGDPFVLSASLSAQHFVLWRRHRVEECLQIASRIVDLAERSDDRRLAVHGRGWRMVDWMILGETGRFAEELEHVARAVVPLRQPRYEWVVANYRAAHALWRGRWNEAEELAVHSLAIGERVGDPNTTTPPLLQMFLSRRERGLVADEEIKIRFFMERYPESPSPRTLLALTLLDLGNLDGARAELDRLAAQGFSDLQREHRIGVLPWLAEVCAALSDRARAELLYAQIEPYAHLNLPIGPAGFAGSGFHYLGLLAAALGQAPLALRHLDLAIRENTRMLGEGWAAWSRAAAARVRVENSATLGANAAVEAEGLLHSARQVATRLGMVRLQREIDSVYRRLTAATSAATPTTPAGSRAKVVALRPGGGARIDTADRAAAEDATTLMLFRLDGQFWSIGRPTRALRLKNAKGFAYLKRLLEHPGQAVHVLDLTGSPEVPADANNAAAALSEGLGLRNWKQPQESGVDPQARGAYRQRLRDLRDELADAERNNDSGRVENLRNEIEFLLLELAGHGARRSSHAERARLNVTRAVKAVIDRIADGDGDLGRYLRTTIRTGMMCRYVPDPRFPLRWAFD